MGSNFCYITLGEMREVLDGWTEVRGKDSREEVQFHQDFLRLKPHLREKVNAESLERLRVVVYSSIPSSFYNSPMVKSRDYGADAIRVVLLLVKEDGTLKPLSKGRKVYRVENWRENLKRVIQDIASLLPEFCNCGWPFIVRMRKVDQVKFLGCVRFPECKGTKELAEGKAG